jgi:SAM-dependent methyltransferase
MSGFSADWLALREPLDARSRSAALVDRLRAQAPRGPRRILDLGSGTGANLRYLAPRLGGEQDWLLVDNDGALLDSVVGRLRDWAEQSGLRFRLEGETLNLSGSDLECRVRRQQTDLARGDLQHLDLTGRWLVTASALLDLVAERWLTGMLRRCHTEGACLLFALSYDGEMAFRPELPDDAWINAQVNRHQSRDKGFGPALGPRAALDAPAMLERCGYRADEAPTPWAIGPEQTTLQAALIDGWSQAAVEVAPTQVERIEHWRRRRHQCIATGESSLRVGHRDLLGWTLDHARD